MKKQNAAALNNTEKRIQKFCVTLRSNERSKLPRASVAAWPALRTLHAERFLWMLPMVNLWNWPESVGPTTR